MSNQLILDQYDMLSAGLLQKEDIQKTATANKEPVHSHADIKRQIDRDFAIILLTKNGDKLRKYPINSKTNVTQSMNAFKTNMHKLPEKAQGIIARRLEEACKKYDMECDEEISNMSSHDTSRDHYYPIPDGMIEMLSESIPGEEKTASDKTEYWGIAETINGIPLRKFPMQYKSQVKRHLQKFASHAPKMMAKYAFEFADNLLKRAEDLGLEVDPDHPVMRYAKGERSPYFKTAMLERVKLCNESDGKLDYLQLTKQASNMNMRQLAVKLEGMDKQYKMHHRYGQNIPNALESVVDYPHQKEAREHRVNGIEIDKGRLRRLLDDNPEAFEDKFSKELIEDLQSNPDDTLAQMGFPQRKLLLELMTSITGD